MCIRDRVVSSALEQYKMQLQNEVLDKANKLKADWNNEFDL